MRVPRPLPLLLLALTVASCAHAAPTPLPPLPAAECTPDFCDAAPESADVDPRALLALAEYIRDTDLPYFSILISRHGKLVFELYTSHLSRDDAHYLMSVTKSVTSALVGLATDASLLRGPDAPLTDQLPARAFPDADARARFRAVTLREVLGMSALDAPVPPHEQSDSARRRQRAFWQSDNRLRFALAQPLLPAPGSSFQYTDVTPILAIGALSYATRQTALEFAQARLFGPLGFKNAEWMHQDRAGLDNGAYGLRLRPLDMQKFGLLYLRGGAWNGRQLLSRAWVAQSFTPWIHHPADPVPGANYGWYWWLFKFQGVSAHVADGWKGQRIAVLPDKDLVVTMTGDFEQGENRAFAVVMNRFVLPAVDSAPPPDAAAWDAKLRAVLAEVRERDRIPPNAEPRMVPSAEAKEAHHGLQLDAER